MRTITAADANRHFSKVLREVGNGQTYTVLSRGRIIARITPADTHSTQREAAKESLLARLREQEASGARDWTRDELYER